MKILIKLKDNREIETEIEKEDYEELQKEMSGGKVKFLNFDGRLLKTSLIDEIEPVAEEVPKEFRLAQPEFEKVGDSKTMKELWETLKSKGLFEKFNSYEEFRKVKNY